MCSVLRTSLLRILLFAASVLFPLGNAFAGDWLAWRGPAGTGVSDEKGAPVSWSKTENIRWKAPLPGQGNSTPIVVGDKVILTCASKKGTIRGTYCYSRTDGKVLWKDEVEYLPIEDTHDTNPFCSSSPVSDGKIVVVWQGSAGLFAYDLEGKRLWTKNLGKFEHIWGNASSPVIHEDLVILNLGPGLAAYVAAFHKNTGDEAWRFEDPEMKSQKFDEFRGSWSTPVLYRSGEKTVLLLSMPMNLFGVDPVTGKELFRCGGLSKLVYTSPLIGKELAVTMCGYHGPSLAVKLGGAGDVTQSHRLWRFEEKDRNPQRVGSGVLVDGHVYILHENGIAWCLAADTGEIRWQQRVGQGSWGSMVYADGRLYIAGMNGDTIVLEADPKECRVVATNKIGETCRSSLAFSNGQIFLRTYENLYCIETKK